MAPPSEVTFPESVAPVDVILLAVEVITDGIFKVVNDITLPYAVPILFIAYAL